MRSVLAFAIALAACAAMVATLRVPRTTASPQRAAVSAQRQEVESPCIPNFDALAAPSEVLPGAPVDLTFTAKVSCRQAVHVVLVVDRSYDMHGLSRELLKTQLHALLAGAGLDRPERADDRVAVVTFGSTAAGACDLTNDAARLDACVEGIDWATSGYKQIGAGLDLGLTLLRNDPAWATVRNVVVLLSDGNNDSGCGVVLAAAGRLKTAGVVMSSVCIGESCDAACMRQAATSPRQFFQIQQLDDARVHYDQTVSRVSLKSLTIHQVLAPSFTYVPGSADPESNGPDDPRELWWLARYVPRDGLTFTLRATAPMTPGSYPTSDEAIGVLDDSERGSRAGAFPVPVVHVLGPGQIPGLGPCAPSKLTASALPGTVTVGDRVTVTLATKAGCARIAQPIHAVLVVDSSGGTAGEVNAQIKKALKTIIKSLDLPGHPQIEVGIVRFASQANTLCELTNDAGRLSSCANKIDSNGGAALYLGLREGLRLLTASRSAAAGEPAPGEMLIAIAASPNNTGCTPAMVAADEAKAQGVTVATVCAGPSCDQVCLDKVSSSPVDRYDLQSMPDLLDNPRWAKRDVVQRLVMNHILPDDMLYVPGSAFPAPLRDDPTEGLVWEFTSAPVTEASVTFAVRPQLAGQRSVGLDAGVVLESAGGSPVQGGTFTLPLVEVLEAATPTPLPTVAWTPPPPTYRLWLPMVWR